MLLVQSSGRVADLRGDLSIDIRDIANALSKINRYTGHTDVPYNDAQHSVLVSRLCPPQFAFAGLMHDAHEAFIGDPSSPMKQLMEFYMPNVFSALEFRIARKVRAYFGLPASLDPSVKEADNRAVGIEIARVCSPAAIATYCSLGICPEYGYMQDVWDNERAYREFMIRFKEVSPFS